MSELASRGDLNGKVAIVTGGANGLGRAIVRRFVAEGARVVIADIDVAKAQAVRDELGEATHVIGTDVSKAEAIQALVDGAGDRFGSIDIMVNNAAVSADMHPRFLDETLTDFDRVLRVNLLGVMLGTQAAARAMAATGGGSVINVTSTSGLLPGFAVTCYRAAKAGVAHFTKSAAIDLAEYGVRVNGIAPGNIRTDINGFNDPAADGAEAARWDRELERVRLAPQPLKRNGSPDDIAQAALFFASDRSAQVTGTILPVDGGVTAGDPVNQLAAIFTAREAFLKG